MKLKSKVLFFISSPVPTEVQVDQADKLTTSRRVVAFRNASQVGDSDSLERADYVCGDVPARYLVQTKEWTPPAVIDLDQPELPLESAPAGSPMSPVATGSEGGAPAGNGEQTGNDTPPTEPTAEDVKNFSAYNIDAVLGMVNAKTITRERAIQLETLGKGRKSLLARLTESVD